MLSKQMLQLAERNQWRTNVDEQTIFGEFNGYLFTGLEGKNFKAFITPVAGISPGALKSLLRFLNENKHALHLRNFEISDNFLCVRQQAGVIPLSVDKMEYLLAQISGLLSLGDMPAGACAVCGQPASKRGLYYGLFCHLHPECQDRELTDFTGAAAQDSDSEDDQPEDDQPDTSEQEALPETGAADGTSENDAAAEPEEPINEDEPGHDC
jgi:hypothetical protein